MYKPHCRGWFHLCCSKHPDCRPAAPSLLHAPSASRSQSR
ncbi:hypothetical protein EVA_16356 [gut metagenome]|uniref:Uncharacterized protein n=1 Tax=gut metagenome TaxID=749906 RepID=J9G175_9ZZZZ